jgi:dolichol-phosphate mannosyltransferase
VKLSVIAPTFNERENVKELINRVGDAIQNIPYEIIIADDDSPDLTWLVAEETSASDPRVHVLRRMQNHGLGAAVIDGFSIARGEILACIDADLQHDPSALRKMLERFAGGADVVVGSRYVAGGSTGNWNWFRRMESRIATRMARIFLGVKLSDPMSGYFLMRRSDFLRIRPELQGRGFKILLEILVKLRPGIIEEVPYTFRTREKGESKLSSKVVLQYVQQLWGLSRLRKLLPDRFIKFSFVGCTGIVVNLGVMTLFFWLNGSRSWVASGVASLIANMSNYGLNNIWTFSDRLHRGIGLMKGYFLYLLMSTVGLGITTASYMGLTSILVRFSPEKFDSSGLAILLLCQFLSISFGSYSNYLLNSLVTWPHLACNGAQRAAELSVLNSREIRTTPAAKFDHESRPEVQDA